MKIAVVAKTRLPIKEPFRGGLESFTHSLCKEYIRSGHEVILYAHADSDKTLNIKGFYSAEHRDSSYFELYENDEYLSILKNIEENNFDVVHNNSTHELPVLWGATSAIPVITTIHTPPISKLKAAVKICSHSKNLHFVFPSKSFEKTWQPFLGHSSTVIYNGIDLSKWPLIRKESKYLFWYGRIVHAKGLDIVMDAAHELNMPLKFAGPTDDKEYFNDYIVPRLTSDDTYLGHLVQDEIHSYMKNAAVMANAVRWEEPFGLTNIEAMASGVPIAGFDRGAFKELVSIESGIIADQKNVNSLAKAIVTARALESKKIRHHAEQFSLKIMVQRYLNFFESIL